MILTSIEYTVEQGGMYRVSCDFLSDDFGSHLASDMMGKDVQLVDVTNMSLPVEKKIIKKQPKRKKPKKIKEEIIPQKILSCYDRMDLSDG